MSNDYEEYRRALIFQKRETIVHVSTNREDFFWCNGLLLEVANDYFVIKDRKDGKEHLILFSELKKPIEKFKEVGE